MKEMRTYKHGSIECFSYLKKHDMENYVKEEVADPEGDEVKAKHKKDLVKTKMSISISIEYFYPQFWENKYVAQLALRRRIFLFEVLIFYHDDKQYQDWRDR